MVQTVMANQSAKLNKKNFFVSIKFVAAIGGLTGGFFLILIGLALSAISYFNHTSFHGWDVIMLVDSLIVLIIGAHFLDEFDAAKKAEKKRKTKNNFRGKIRKPKQSVSQIFITFL